MDPLTRLRLELQGALDGEAPYVMPWPYRAGFFRSKTALPAQAARQLPVEPVLRNQLWYYFLSDDFFFSAIAFFKDHPQWLCVQNPGLTTLCLQILAQPEGAPRAPDWQERILIRRFLDGFYDRGARMTALIVRDSFAVMKDRYALELAGGVVGGALRACAGFIRGEAGCGAEAGRYTGVNLW
jgi:hypothetical protein